MPATLTVRDDTTSGGEIHSFPLEFPTERITVRELIRERVYQEVQDYNRREPEYFRGLVQPTDAEQTLNGFKIRKARQIDWKMQFDKATEAFQRNGFFILIDDKQADTLDDEFTIGHDTQVSFVKLTPLVGG
jgi:hypothetical protein